MDSAEEKERTEVDLEIFEYRWTFASSFWPHVIGGVLFLVCWISCALLLGGILGFIGYNVSFLQIFLLSGLIPIIQNWRRIAMFFGLF